MMNQLSILAFYAKYPGWYTYKKNDRATVNAVRALEKKGFLEVIGDQARFTGKTFKN